MAEVKWDGNLMSWATCQWNLAEGDKSGWTVIYLPSTDSHTNQCTLVLIKLRLSKHLFPLQRWWKQLQPVWTWIHQSDLCGLKCTDYLWTTYSILYAQEANNIWYLQFFIGRLHQWFVFLGPNYGETFTCTFAYFTFPFIYIFMFGSAYFGSCKKSPNKHLTSNVKPNMMDLSSLTLSLFLVFVPGKSKNINKCWIWACIYLRFQSLPDSKFALSLFCSSSFSDLALLAIKCQHLFPYANIITCFRISAHTWFGLHSH